MPVKKAREKKARSRKLGKGVYKVYDVMDSPRFSPILLMRVGRRN